ncbi:hypothetical protein Taro_033313 [Colocasia esculenta]|uniref:Uncharacterized protein n=1 Tax=Colocasia esculenta TaxID=4460 RepID=A0A843W1B2_COLES|nr:hypothetical protein [Colocasia esculenta]
MAASVLDAFKKVATQALVSYGQCGVVSLHSSYFVEVEKQLDLSSVAARLRGVRESRRVHVPPLVPVSAVVESGPDH